MYAESIINLFIFFAAIFDYQISTGNQSSRRFEAQI